LIYLDSSVALAQLLSEERRPSDKFWREPMFASRLLEYEIWNRLNARELNRSHGGEARMLIDRLTLLELAPPVLKRALEPFPTHIRTLDSIHLASIEFLRSRGQTIELASYDERLLTGGRALGIPVANM
jgi:hypothetical protein